MRYRVWVGRSVEEVAADYIEVEATDIKEARRIACERARNGFIEWRIDGEEDIEMYTDYVESVDGVLLGGVDRHLMQRRLLS